MLKRQTKLFLVLAGAVFAIGFALFSQYVQKFNPCEMCIWQRWVYGAVIFLSIVALALNSRMFRILVSLALLTQVALAFFHTGVELKWWQGFTSCSSGLGGGLTLEELKAKIEGAPVIRCDEATWILFGLSMAAWNAIFAFGLLVISLLPCRKSSS